MYEALCLSALREGESAYVTQVNAGPAMDRRLTDLGLVRGTRVTCVLRSPAGDPCAYLIRGALIALRRADADGVALERQAQAVPARAVATS
ncbi:MAG: ferrous iron transport protein A [Clostridiales bacterium]|nr:ferrous iron transport protein A [Clostridiales bacterium]